MSKVSNKTRIKIQLSRIEPILTVKVERESDQRSLCFNKNTYVEQVTNDSKSRAKNDPVCNASLMRIEWVILYESYFSSQRFALQERV